jgi:hypothetical protein
VLLVAFELRRIAVGDNEAWFWLAVGALMAVLGTIGVFQRPVDG